MTYELRHNPGAPDGNDDTMLYEGDGCREAPRRPETFGSLEGAMLALAARGLKVGSRSRTPPFEYGGRIYRNVSRWEVTA